MSNASTKRKMAAILSADVKGYSRLMSADEEGTVKALNACREIIGTCVRDHQGRIVDSPGDNVLVEFASTVEAVKCAVKIQENIKIRNADLPESRRMEFRIGVNLGDVIEEEGRIYGDGVNIAARLEGLAEGGGICISGTAFDQVKNKLPVGYQYLGKQAVKNIPDPVRAYKVLLEPESAGKVIGETEPKQRRWGWKAVAAAAVLVLVAGGLLWNFYWRAPKIEPASKEKMAFPLPDRPSIAILPFANMSGNPEQDYFCDGITDQIITSLSMVPRLFVIARNSTFVYKGKAVKVQKVAEEQGVQYVLEGGVQKSEDKVRITVQLIDAIKGVHLWSERYDRDLKELFPLQDEIAMKIMTALQVKLTEGDYAKSIAGGTSNLKALECFWHAEEHFFRFAKEENAAARQWAEKAIEQDRNFGGAWALLGFTHLHDVIFAWGNSPGQSMNRAEDCAHQAISINDSTAKAQALMGMIRQFQGKYDETVEYCEKAVAINPNDPTMIVILARAIESTARFDEAIALYKKAMRVCPYYPAFYLQSLAGSYVLAGRYQEAVEACELVLSRSRKGEIDPLLAHIHLAEAYVGLGQLDKAREQTKEVLEINPKYSLENAKILAAYKDPMVKERRIAALRKAGLPEKPPLPLPDKPSIAVLPFVNMSDDKGQEFFSDGLTEEIITALSKTPKLFVIARNSTFTYKGKAVNVQQVSRELGVKYVLEGSVRKSGDQLRITAQLIDATTGNHLWAERYDRELKEIFAIQDEVTMKILTSLQVTLTEGEQAKFFVKGTKSLEAYLKTLEARELLYRLNKDDNALAIKRSEEAIALDPEYSRAFASLSAAYSMNFYFRVNPMESLRKAYEYAQKAITLDDTQLSAYIALEFVYSWKREYEEAIAAGEKAVKVAPGSADAYLTLGRALNMACRDKEALEYVEKAIRLNPFPPTHYYMHLGFTNLHLRNYEQAVSAFKMSLSLSPKNQPARGALIVTYVEMGRMDDARAEAEELLRIDPKWTSKGFEKMSPYKDPEVTKRRAEAWRKVGLERDVTSN
jgi:adenylate cyclase